MTSKDTQSKRPVPLMDPEKLLLTRQDLRMQAEEITRKQLALSLAEIATIPHEKIQQTYHELLVHQVQLEMQNEALRRMQIELNSTKARYFDLYDLAPMGYLTVSDEGLILETNLTAATLLGVPRQALLNKPLSRFILTEDQDAYYLHRQQLTTCASHSCELRVVKQDQTVFWAYLVITVILKGDTLPEYLVALSDITEHKQFERALHESEERYRLLFESAYDAFFLIDSDTGRIVKANKMAAELFGYNPEELLTKNYADLSTEPEMTRHSLQQAQTNPHWVAHIPQRRYRKKDGTVFPVEITARAMSLQGQQVILATVRDITERKQVEAIMAARLRLLQSASTHSLAHLLQATLDEAEKLTDSQIAFYHFMEPDQTTLSMQAWSTNTLERMCKAGGTGLHYAVSQAGVWVDCVHARRPIIHNDYAALPHRKGLPEGHVPVIRALVVPVMRGDAIVALLGVGNKAVDYNQQNIAAVSALADFAWDITERKRVEEALLESEQQRSQAQEAANALLTEQAENLTSIYQALDSVGLIVCDLEKGDARITIFSVGAEKLFGYQQAEAIGRSITLIYPPEFIEVIPNRVRRFRQGKPMQSFNMTLVRKLGDHFPAVVSVHPFDAHAGRFRKVVGVFRDISQLILIQEQLQAANDELERRVEQRTRELQESQKQYLHAEKLSAIGKLSASIAHEFNNPLQGILSILRGLKKRAILEPEDKELLDAAISESERIKNLIRSLQEFNRPSSGRKVVMDVHKSLDAILLLHKCDFKNRRITQELKYTENLPQILAIPDQIKQVFLNLLTNAGDACQERGGVITISTWQEDDRVAVAIQDTGVGIKPEEMEHIFQPFYTTKPAVKGTGLGLSVSHGIIKYHQGEIRVKSRPGEGATFTVLLPINADAIPAAVYKRAGTS